jgi:CRP/FNR family transcriptional regulator
LAQLAPQQQFWKGAPIGEQGSACTRLYIIASGQVLLSRRSEEGVDRPMYLLGVGDLFGEGSLRPERVWLFQARALTDVTAHALPSAHLPKLAQYYPQLTAHIVRLLAERLERSHSRVDLVRTHGARDRLMGLFQVLAERHGEPEGDRIWVPLTVTQEEIGAMVGLARETVARLLTELEEAGVLDRGRRGVWLKPAMAPDSEEISA